MKKIFLKNFVYLAMGAVLLTVSWDAAASQTSDKLKNTGKKINELEEQKENAKEKVGSLKEEENQLKGELSELNQQLSDVSAQMNDLEIQITEKEAEIETTSRELKEAEGTKESQYESMKLRIRFIYENGGIDLASVFLGSSSLADILNRAEYVEDINRYDRQMLDAYEETCRQISQKKKDLQMEEKELVVMQKSMEQKKEEVGSLIAKTQQSIQVKQDEILDAQETVNGYEAQIAKMKAYEEELERKKAEEARKKAEEQRKAEEKRKVEQKKETEKQKENNEGSGGSGSTGTGGSGGGPVTSNASDLAMLAALVECEAGGESYEGQLAVASVVVNRVRSGSFPNTVSGVIYQGGQFSPVASGRFAVVLARGAAASCTKAAGAALSGGTNVSFLYFCRASSGVEGTVIGNHVFY